ncbi:hypothetical protein IAR50_006738 [Cryptococcus sp. DSM 104548]
MGRSKKHSNKKPPPKPRPAQPEQPQPSSSNSTTLPPLPAFPLPPPHTLPPVMNPAHAHSPPSSAQHHPHSHSHHAHAHAHPSHSHSHHQPMTPASLSAALHTWSANALKSMGLNMGGEGEGGMALPTLTESQIRGLTGGGALGDGGFFMGPAGPSGSGGGHSHDHGHTHTYPDPATGSPIDLPSSLAALFEAKLTLDREKAKLLKMQEELEGQKEIQGLREMMDRPMPEGAFSLPLPMPMGGPGGMGMGMPFRIAEGGVGMVGMGVMPVRVGGQDGKMVLEEGCTCGQCQLYIPEPEPDECFDCEDDCGCDCHSYEEYDCEHDEEYVDEEDEDYDDEDDEEYEYEDEIDDEELYEERPPLAQDPERLDEYVSQLFNWVKTVVYTTIEQKRFSAHLRQQANAASSSSASASASIPALQ